VDSARERHELRRIERWLAVNDPALAASLSAPGAGPRRVNCRSVRFAAGLLGAACVLIGALASVLTLVFVGVMVLMVGACLHATRV
jgi:hypothetical protein